MSSIAEKRKKLHILYIHGLESTNLGWKARYLKERYSVHAPNLQTSIWNPTKRNAFLRHTAKNPWLIFSTMLFSFVAGTCVRSVWKGSTLKNARFQALVASCLVCTTVTIFQRKQIVQAGASRCVKAVMSELRKELKVSQPDIIVASSLGGALAVRLMTEGTWKGKTLLLNPAQTKLSNLMGEEQTLELPIECEVVLLHGTADKTIPLRHSEALAKANPFLKLRFVKVDGEGHSLNQWLNENARFEELVDNLAGFSRL